LDEGKKNETTGSVSSRENTVHRAHSSGLWEVGGGPATLGLLKKRTDVAKRGSHMQKEKWGQWGQYHFQSLMQGRVGNRANS